MKIRSARSIVAALFAVEIASAFKLTSVYAALSALVGSFGDPLVVGWLVTTHLLVGAGACAVAGRAGDIYGRRRVTLVLLLAAVAGSLIGATTRNVPALVIGQGLQGLSTALLPLSFGILRERLSPDRVPFNIGVLFSGAGVGTATGLVGGGWIVDHYNWHWMYAGGGFLAFAAFLLVFMLIPPDPPVAEDRNVDWIGGVLFVPAIGALLFGVSKMKDMGATDPIIMGTIGGGLALMALWVWQSLRSANPFIDVRLLVRREVALANILCVLVALGTSQMTMLFSLMMQSPSWTGVGLGLSATAAGLVKLPSNICSIAAGPLGGWLAAHRSGRVPMLIGGALTTLGWLAPLFIDLTPATAAAILIVISFGTTLQYAALPTIIVAAVPPERTSEATGMMQVVRTTFMGIGAQLVAVMLNLDTISESAGGPAFPSSFAIKCAMGMIAGLALAATLFALTLSPRRATP